MAISNDGTPPSMPRVAGELHTVSDRQAVQNTNRVAELDVLVAGGPSSEVQRENDFGQFLNDAQQISEARAQTAQGLVYDPVQEMYRTMTLEGARSQGEEPI